MAYANQNGDGNYTTYNYDRNNNSAAPYNAGYTSNSTSDERNGAHRRRH